MLLAGLLEKALDGRQEQLPVGDVEDDRDVRSLAQVGVVAGDGEALDEGRAECLTQGHAPQTELLLIALAELVVPALHLVDPKEVRPPLVEQLAEIEELSEVLEVDIVVVVGDEVRERLPCHALAL